MFGPRALKQTHPAYKDAIVNSMNEQMLQNLVRMRYRDVPMFLEISSVTTSLSMSTEISASLPDSFSLSPSVTISDNPTISYTPLRGEELLKGILSPLELQSMLVFTKSGWSISRVLGLCIERLNNLQNAPTASGPTPDFAPEYEEYKELISLLRKLQLSHLLEFGLEELGDQSQIVVKFSGDSHEMESEFNRIYELLGLDPNRHIFNLNSNFLSVNDSSWTVRTRSMTSVLYYLSQNVKVPAEHEAVGLVTVTEDKNGNPFDWNKTPAGAVFKISSSKSFPSNAFVTTFYRGHWFYIEDLDLNSKSTFSLVLALFNLQSGRTKYQGPTLTLPVGG